MPRTFRNAYGHPIPLLSDAEALQGAAEHVERAGLAGAAALMRRCASRLRDAHATEPDKSPRKVT